MRDFFKTVFSYNFFKVFIYFIFVFSGSLKWIPFPIDITLFGAFLCTMVLVLEIKSITIFRKEVYIQVLLMLLLMFFFLVSNLYTVSYIYSEKKNIAMILNFLTVLYPFVVFKKIIFEELKNLMYVIGVLAIVILLYVYFTYSFIIFFDVTQYSESIPTYLTVGIMLSACFIFSMSSQRITVPLIIYRIILLFLLTQLGGRGPLFNLVLCIGVYYFLNLKNIKLNYKVVLSAMAAFFVFLFYLHDIIDLIIENVNIDRFNLLKASDEDGSVLYRVMVINKGLESFYNHPFVGTGIGSSGIALTGIDQVEFPHNLLVESMIELGIIGGLAYIIIYLYFFIRNLKTVRTDKKLLVLYVMCLLFFLEDMKSGSFDAWRVSLFWMSLYLVQYNFRINYPSKKFIHSV